jgi:hypothetical protein
MQAVRFVVSGLLFLTCLGSHPLMSEETAPPSPNTITTRFDFDPLFLAYSTFTGTHAFSDVHALSGSFVTYLNYLSLEFDLSWTFMLGNLSISPGFGTTFGPGSWNLSTDKRIFVGRDITPIIALYYRNTLFEAESFNQAWIPVQESPATSIGFGWIKLWGVVKWNEIGIGPHFESFFEKEGNINWRLSHLWIGGHLLANLKGASFHLFGGYDTVSLGTFAGTPKAAGPVFRGTFIYAF